MKQQAVLIGPFVGELFWEYFYFAPYVIHLKKMDPHEKFVIFTRLSRFDLYGIYSDVFVPLRLDEKGVCCFKKEELTGEDFNMLLGIFIKKFKERYKIKDIIYPDIKSFYYKVKWQFPRSKMDYDFQPRNKNIKLVDRILYEKENVIFIDSSVDYDNEAIPEKYYSETGFDFFCKITNISDGVKSSTLGCVIEVIKRSEFVISNMESDIGRLAVLLNKPLISIDEKLTDDEIHLLNPLGTPIIRCSSVKEGIEIYENNF